jgi:hypothetical protein
MSDQDRLGAQTAYQFWSQWAACLLGYQRTLFETHRLISAHMLGTLQSTPASPSSDSRAELAQERNETFRSLEDHAAERAQRGFAPPREIYDSPCRDFVDWTRFPTWARPSDPELFDGCVHEG